MLLYAHDVAMENVTIGRLQIQWNVMSEFCYEFWEWWTNEKQYINNDPFAETTYTSILVLSFVEGSVCQQLINR